MTVGYITTSSNHRAVSFRLIINTPICCLSFGDYREIVLCGSIQRGAFYEHKKFSAFWTRYSRRNSCGYVVFFFIDLCRVWYKTQAHLNHSRHIAFHLLFIHLWCYRLLPRIVRRSACAYEPEELCLRTLSITKHTNRMKNEFRRIITYIWWYVRIRVESSSLQWILLYIVLYEIHFNVFIGPIAPLFWHCPQIHI